MSFRLVSLGVSSVYIYMCIYTYIHIHVLSICYDLKPFECGLVSSVALYLIQPPECRREAGSSPPPMGVELGRENPEALQTACQAGMMGGMGPLATVLSWRVPVIIAIGIAQRIFQGLLYM